MDAHVLGKQPMRREGNDGGGRHADPVHNPTGPTRPAHVGGLHNVRRVIHACAVACVSGFILQGCAAPEPAPRTPKHWVADSGMAAVIRSGDFEVVVRVADLPEIEPLSRANMRPYGPGSMADSDGGFGEFSPVYLICPIARPCHPRGDSYPMTRLLAAAVSKQWVLLFVEGADAGVLTLRMVDRSTWAACDYQAPSLVWRDLVILTPSPQLDPQASKGRSSNAPPRRAAVSARTEDLKRAIQRGASAAPFPGRVTACRDAVGKP